MDASRQQSTGGLNVWVTGDLSYLQMDNYHGFPDDPGRPVSVVAGASARLPGDIIVGAALAQGRLKSEYSAGRGNFEQNEFSGSLYGGFFPMPFWATLVGTYGDLGFDVNRIAPIGITLQNNFGKTNGSNLSVAAQAGFAIGGCFKQGPVVGLAWQRVEVDGFTEKGSFTSLSFGDQSRNSTIASIGYKATTHCGTFRPFAEAIYNQELASTGHDVTATLTTSAAPSYRMPGVELDKRWGTARLGANVVLGPGVTGLAAFSIDAGQSDFVNYGAQVGINFAF